MINRRGLITGLISLVAAPAIVRVANIMPVKAITTDMYYECVTPGHSVQSAWFRVSLTEEESLNFYARLNTYMRETGVSL